jgi:hypothetical protein
MFGCSLLQSFENQSTTDAKLTFLYNQQLKYFTSVTETDV